MKRLLVLLFCAACGSSTEPLAGDPALLVTNDLDASWVFVTWKDGQGIIGRDSVPPRTASQCIRFTAQPDSAYWQISASENGHTTEQTAAWFNPSDRPAWSVHVYEGGGVVSVPVILAQDTEMAC